MPPTVEDFRNRITKVLKAYPYLVADLNTNGDINSSPNWGRPGGGLMHSRYCLRHELGYCTKSGRKAPWREPLTLHLADGKSFNIKFDCKQCEMYIMR